MKVVPIQTMNSIQQSMSDYARNSVTVDINSSQFWVTIKNIRDGESLFLQGDEAVEFISQYESLCELYPDNTFYELALLTAYPYCDSF